MAYQSKTYSLSDEVVAAIKAAKAQGLSPNKYLRQLIGLDAATTEAIRARVVVKNEINGRRTRFTREKGDSKR